MQITCRATNSGGKWMECRLIWTAQQFVWEEWVGNFWVVNRFKWGVWLFTGRAVLTQNQGWRGRVLLPCIHNSQVHYN